MLSWARVLAVFVASVIGSVLCPAQSTQVEEFDSEGHTIRFVSAGEGEPVVLLHGWMGEAANWGPGSRAKPVLNAPPGFRVLAPDLRGHGLSAKPHTDSDYGPEMAKDVIRLLDHLEIERAHVVGYSMGAYVAGKVVDLAPDRVLSVVYGGSSPVLDSRAVKRFSAADAFSAAVASGQLGQYLIDTAPAGSQLTLEQANRLAERTYGHQDVAALAAAGRSFARLEVSAARLGSLSVPSLLIYGSEESAFVLDRMAEARAALPGAEVIVIAGANHVTALRSPEFGRSLVSFWSRHRASEPPPTPAPPQVL